MGDVTCSACGGALPSQGAYQVRVSLRPDAPLRWRTTSIVCSLRCLAAVTAEMQAAVVRRQQRQERQPSLKTLMTERPRGRRDV